MLTKRLLLAIPLFLLAARAGAQGVDSALTTDTVFLRVQRLAANGQGDAARALAQEQFEAAPTASPRYVEALYWRAVVAATAADAERDLQTIIVDYPLSPWSVEALMRLAQLEMTRRDMDKALAHLNRVMLEHPNSPSRPKASFWIARVEFEQGKLADACRQLGDAGRTAPVSDVELRNQIEYWATRCNPADTALAVVSSRDSARSDPAAAAAAFTPTPAPAPAANVGVAAPAATAAAASVPKKQYTVQVGAYNTKSAADALAKNLKDRGYEARVYGTAAPFRVRVGRYDKHSQADAEASKLNAKKIAAFVTDAEPQ
jgi:cell division septation protein DedD